MKILLVNIDSKQPNLALHKVEKFYKDKGHQIDWLHLNKAKKWSDGFFSTPALDKKYSKIFVSCVFTKNKDECKVWEGKALIGGSGYSLSVQLPEKIERVKPKINYGFTTRGCIRKCKFCVVPEKERLVHPVGDLLDLWDGKSKLITVLDNNILALPKHFKKICHQAQENKIKLDFSQGLDHRLLTADLAKVLKNIRHVEYRFSFDHPSYVKTVEKAINILKEQGIKRSQWYVLVGFDTTFEEDLFRLDFLRDLGQVVYVMRYSRERIYIPLARWANQAHIFRAMDWKSFLEHKENKRYRKLFK